MTKRKNINFVKGWERLEYLEKVKDEYYKKIDEEISDKMHKTTSEWKNVTEKQREINKKETGFYETNLERKKREASIRENKLIKREQQVENLLRKKEGVFCIFCKTKADKDGLCYC